MSIKEFTIYFCPIPHGLGDAIVGCSSAFILSKVLKTNFKIIPGQINIYAYFDIPDENKIFFNNQKYDITFNYDANRDNDFNKYLFSSNLDNLKNKNILIVSCQNFSRFLYKNNNFNIDIEEEKVIKYLFENILIPKKPYLEKLNSYIDLYDLHNTTCVQIRCCSFFQNDDTNRINIEKTVYSFINCIKFLNPRKLLVMSDNMTLIKKILDKENIKFITTPGIPQHSIDPNIDFEKVIVDLLVIGECKNSIISHWSNFSRIGVLRTLKDSYIVRPVGNDPKDCLESNIDFTVSFRRVLSIELLSKEKSELISPIDKNIIENLNKEIEIKNNCENCKKTSDKLCSNCKKVSYCSRDCQLEHWKIHKKYCK